jgi:stalled ribosome rescue protein Dom34
MPKHTAVWIDHQEARIFHIDPATLDAETVMESLQNSHHKHGSAKGHPEDDKRFFHDVSKALEGTDDVLIVGPSTGKLAFLKYVQKHDHALEPRIVGIETVDHPTDAQLVAYATTYFKRTDRLQ